MSEEMKQSNESGAYKWFALLAIVIGTFAAVLNSSLLNVALPKLIAVMGSTQDTMQWILTGYMLASAVVIPFSGYLGDKFGYKTVFTVSLIGFTVGTFLCGMAWSDSSLIAFRIFQGVAGGLIMPIGMTIIYSLIPRNQIGTALGLWGIAAMSAPAIGPTLSGYIVEHYSWRVLFFLNVPVGILAVLMGMILLKETPKKPGATLDKAGAVLSVIAFGTMLLALSKGQTEGWTSLYIVSLFFVAFFSLALLVWVELGQKQPVLEVRLFANPVFSLSVLTSSLVTVGMFGGIFLLPIYLQNIQGLSAVQTGILMLPQSIVMALMMPISGRLFDKIGIVPIGLVGLSLVGVTTYELHRLAIDTPNDWLNMILTIRGIGIGLCMQPLSTIGMNAVPPQLIGQASPLSNVTRQVMGSMAIAVFTMLMSQRTTIHTGIINDTVSITNTQASQTMSTLTGIFTQGGLDATSAQAMAASTLGGLIAKEATVRAIGDTFLLASIPIFICIPLVLLFAKRKKTETPPAKLAAKTEEQQAKAVLEPEPVLSR